MQLQCVDHYIDCCVVEHLKRCDGHSDLSGVCLEEFSISICNIWHSKARLFMLDVVFGTLEPTDKVSIHKRLSAYHVV